MIKDDTIEQGRLRPLTVLQGAGMINGISNADFGNMSLVYGDTAGALSNRENFLRKLNVDHRNLVMAEQVHGSKVAQVTGRDRGKGTLSYDMVLAGVDALVTEERNLPLAVFTADCLPIFLYDRQIPAIGLVHAGWRGTKENIVARTISLMERGFKSRPQDLIAGFGPSIKKCCYEVGREFQKYFTNGLIERNGSYFLDLAGINTKQLLEAGVQRRNILDPGICTACRNNEFFSFRRQGISCGRMISVIMLK
jgi:YfiH family protein